MAAAGSSDWDMTLGVALSVPQVMSCLSASGPSSDALGEGKFGTNVKPSSLARGRSVLAVNMALPIGIEGTYRVYP